MTILGLGLTRRDWLKRIGLAAALIPLAPLGKVLAKEERRRRRAEDVARMENLWIGHC